MAQSQAQLENLKKGHPPFDHETARKNGKKGQPLSVIARKRNTTAAQMVQKISESQISNKDVRSQLQQIGLDDQDLTNAAMLVAGIFQQAAGGNLAAYDKWESLLARAQQENGIAEDGTRKQFLIPAIYVAKNFVDLNRNVEPGVEYIVEGGRGSTKSSWISLKIIEILRNNPTMHACVIRKIKGTLRDSVYEQLKWAIDTLGFSDEYKCTVSPMQIRDLKTDQRIYFRGLDDPTKLKSIKPPAGGYIGLLWIEEADQLFGPEELRNVKQSLLRGGDGISFLSYNPPKSRSAWVNSYAAEAKTDEKAVVHHTTYLDVPPEWLGPTFLDDAEHLKKTNPAAYEHEYLGVPTGDGGAVFDNIEARTITDDEIKQFDRVYQGVDWGYSPDPFVLIRVHYDHHRETIYFLDEIYVTKKTNSQTADMIKKKGYTDTYITCDSAEPKSVADFRTSGLPAQAAVKGPDSVRYGIKWLCGRKLVFDPKRTPHAFKEFSEYEHDRDRDGNPVSSYPDKNNHTIDATRYALERVWSKYYSRA